MRALRWFLPAVLFAGCASEQAYDVLQDYEQLNASTIIDAPTASPGSFAPEDLDVVNRGEYLVELLGCGSCHTNGAFEGNPDMTRPLAGSRTGIAYTSPLAVRFPGVVYPANITSDVDTGIGSWTGEQIAKAIRAGKGRHGKRRIATMPWPGYAKLSDDDVAAIVSYLRTVKAVRHEVPADVAPGSRAKEGFVYFGVYRSRK